MVILKPATFIEGTQCLIEQKAYRDTWGRGIDSYVQWFYETAVLMESLLKPTGSLYVHVDPSVVHYVKCVLDEVMPADAFKSEIIWKRTSAHSSTVGYGPIHEVILYYVKSSQFTWNQSFQAYDEFYLSEFYTHFDLDGRRWRRSDLTGAGTRKGETGKPWRGINVTAKGRHWSSPPAELEKLDAAGKIHWPAKEGGMPMFKRYADEQPGVPLQDIWTDLSPLHNLTSERTGYPTQKPEALLERILKASSNAGDLVLDCFCGSGTTAAVAEKLGRRWITCDLGRFAIHTARKRLLAVPGVRPFEVQNLGRYERSAWQAAEFGESFAGRQEAYHRFILALYKGEYRSGNPWVHGSRRGRLLHVGAVDAPVTLADIRAVAAEARKMVGSGAGAPTELGIDVLFWDLAFEVNEAAVQIARDAGVSLRVYKIPNEVMEKKAVDGGDIQFHELAALGVVHSAKGRTAKVELTDFAMSLDYVPDEVRQSVTHWSQWVDYWAVDWDAKGDAFHNEWQAYRTKKEPRLTLSAEHAYAAPGEYRVLVKVIDLLGNDTTKALRVVVK